MYWAAERRGGKIVNADAAKAWGDYRCPTCKAEVFLRSGRRRASHFAHMPGQGNLDCEFFHYTGDLGRVPQTSTPQLQPKHVDPLSLSIELDPEPQKRGPRKWRLRLTVPQSPDEHGQVAINLGEGDIRKISLAKLSIGAETYTVALDEPDFGASWISPEVRSEYRDAVRHRVLGLDPKKGNAFATGRSKLKPRNYSLSWGESYYFVWRTDCGIAAPEVLACKPLARTQHWDCSLVSLPHDPDDEIEAWIRDQCDLSVDRSVRDWAVIYPASYAFGDDGEIYLPVAEQIILALKSADEGSIGELTCSTRRASIVSELRGTRQHLISIRGSDRFSADKLHIGWDGDHLTTLAVRPYPASSPELAVTVASAGPHGQARAQLHTADGQALLHEVRHGGMLLTEIHGHSALRGQLRTRSCRSSDWFEHSLEFTPHAASPAEGKIDSHLLSQINLALRDTLLDTQIDFGHFGVFVTEAQHTSLHAELWYPKSLRARIEWLCRACKSFAAMNGAPIASLSNHHLLMHLDTIKVPAHLLAHRRAIDSELRPFHDRGGHD